MQCRPQNLWSREGRRESFFWWRVICNGKWRFQNFWLQGVPCQIPPKVENLDFSIRKILRNMIGLLTVMILKRVAVFSFRKTNLQHVRLKMEKRWSNLWWCSIYWKLYIHLRYEAFKDPVKLELQHTRTFNWSLVGLNTNTFQ